MLAMESRVKTLEYILKAGAIDQALQLAAELADEGEDLQLHFSLPSKEELESRLPELRVVARTNTSERPRGQIIQDHSDSVPFPKAVTQAPRFAGKSMPSYTVQSRGKR